LRRRHVAPEIRVGLVGLPPLLRDILTTALARTSDVGVVGCYADRAALIEALPLARLDAIVVAPQPAERAEVARRWLTLAPHAAVLALSCDDRDLTVSHLTLHSETVHDVSADALVEALRSTVKSCGCDL
jgi:DNA-binding NarL/FixJ family response regulator